MQFPVIEIQVDLRNPAQFFACCGVLELASRLWPGSEGWFSPQEKHDANACFCVSTHGRDQDPLKTIVDKITEPETVEFGTGHEMEKNDRKPLYIIPFRLRLDWWCNFGDGSSKSKLKTWAGQQKPEGIIKGLLGEWREKLRHEGDIIFRDLFVPFSTKSKGFGFNPESSWKPIDIGFSLERQSMKTPISPASEILAAVGLQRFRPFCLKQTQGRGDNAYRYRVWEKPLEVSIAPVAMVTNGINCAPTAYEFSVVKRNQNYSAFDWAKPVEEN